MGKQYTARVRTQAQRTQMARRKLDRVIESHLPPGRAVECKILGKWYSCVCVSRDGD